MQGTLKGILLLSQIIFSLETYFGIVKVKILPPKGLYHPVLPYRSQDKLKFPLCRTCTCSDAERAITGTYYTPEMLKAFAKGYKVLHIYEVYHWDESMTYDKCQNTGCLFSNISTCFLNLSKNHRGGLNIVSTLRLNKKSIWRTILNKKGSRWTPPKL